MKSISITAIILSSITVLSSTAFGRVNPAHFTQVASLTEVRTSPLMVSADQGTLAVNPLTKKVTIHLLKKECPSRDCTLQPMYQMNYEIISIEESCGSQIITAQQVEGLGAISGQVTIADHRNRTCRDLVPHVTEVKQIVEARGQVMENYFGGSALAPTYE